MEGKKEEEGRKKEEEGIMPTGVRTLSVLTNFWANVILKFDKGIVLKAKNTASSSKVNIIALGHT